MLENDRSSAAISTGNCVSNTTTIRMSTEGEQDHNNWIQLSDAYFGLFHPDCSPTCRTFSFKNTALDRNTSAQSISGGVKPISSVILMEDFLNCLPLKQTNNIYIFSAVKFEKKNKKKQYPDQVFTRLPPVRNIQWAQCSFTSIGVWHFIELIGVHTLNN